MKLDRLIGILVVLLRRERVQARELAEMFEVSVRTILRDVDAINLAGIPVVTYQGTNGGIGIAEGYRLDRSILTSDDMAAIMAMLKGVRRTIPDPRHEILMEKLKNILPSTQLQNLDAKTNQLFIDLSPWGGDEQIKEKLTGIRNAIEQCKEVEVIYMDAVGVSTNRRIEPYSLVLKGQNWYLYAWCCMREDFRLFKLSRIEEFTVLETHFQPKDVSLENVTLERDWGKHDNMVELEMVFEKQMERILKDWHWGEMVTLEDERIMVKALFPEDNWLYGFILSFGTGIEVVNPPHIRKILREIAQDICKKYL
ncbi:YafY family protein [Clostridiaceae bacterium 35-E11]